MTTDDNEDGDTGAPSDLRPVVGIGASAGGLAALQELFGYMPSDTGLAFVVVVHLSPEHESHLPNLLQSHTQMPVTQVAETVQMEPDHVYVIPPGSNLTAVDTHLRLSELEEERSRRAPIDHFFETLAETHHRTAIGVVLTGTGSDGTLGLQKIRERGGLTIAQDPAEAEYDSMPQTAIFRGVVDRVLPLSEIPDQIVRFATTEPMGPGPDHGEALERDEQQAVQKILTHVRVRTGHDFSRFKPAAVTRRIHRRMQLQQVETLEEYAQRIRSDLDEVRQLVDDLLITATTFFRDPETLAVLERDLIPTLFEGKTEQDRVRVWSVGCATGEGTYSLAILLLEHASRLDRPPQVQVFATDLHEASLQRAREGLYPGTIEADVSRERLERFFVRENDHYRIRPAVREAVVFARHNVMADPPFSRLDLISCRNMLNYLQREVQDEILTLFHYALRSGGYLLLGGSETIEDSKLFRRSDRSHRIYRSREGPAQEPRLPVFSLRTTRFSRRDRDVLQWAEGVPDSGALHHRIVEQYAPPSILVNEDHVLVHSSARARRYLTVPSGEPTNDVSRLVREPLRMALRAGLLAVRDGTEAHRSKPVRLEVEGETAHVMVRVQPVDDDERANLYLVIFDEVPAPESEGTGEERAPEGLVQELEEELAATRAHLQAVIDEHDMSQEEMQASNEELQSMNEELRSTMEELETSKEELQSINEELAVVDQENRHKVEELAQLSSDLQNLLSATDIATLFLDRQLRIMRFTPPLTELFNMRPSDRGRPISDLTHQLGDIALEADALEVLDSLVPLRREVQSVDERWFLTSITPYRSTEDRIEGVVITFVDITDRKHVENALRDREARLAAEAQALTRLDEISERLWQAPGLEEGLDEMLEGTISLLGGDKGNIQLLDEGRLRIVAQRGFDPDFIDLLEGVGPGEDPACHRTLNMEDVVVIEDVEADEAYAPLRSAARSAGYRAVTSAPLAGSEGAPLGVLSVHFGSPHRPDEQELHRLRLFARKAGGFIDRQRAEAALRESEERYRRLFTEMDQAYAVVELVADDEGDWADFRFVDANPAFEQHTGVEDPVGRTGTELLGRPNPQWVKIYGRVAKTGKSVRIEESEPILGRTFDLNIFRVGSEADNRIAALFSDITERKETEEALRESEERFRTLSNLIPDLLWRSDPTGYTSWYNQRWTEYTGQTVEEAVGWGWMDVIHPDSREKSAENYRRAAEERKPLEEEQRIRRHDGTYRWFLVRAEPLLDDDGEVRYFFGSATDIHEQRTALEKLEERVHERTREVRELARTLTMTEQEERRRIARVLHDDIQQLLFGVHLRLSYLSDDMAKLDESKLQEGFEEAQGWIDMAIAQTRELSVGLNPPVLKDEGLSEALRWLASQMRQNHHLEADLRFEDEVRVNDEDARSLLFQTVRELLFNVVKHAGVDQATVSLRLEGDSLELEVSDEGAGFDLETARFSGSHATGLGLFSVRERIRLIGGTVAVDTAPGEGSRVRVTVPVSASGSGDT